MQLQESPEICIKKASRMRDFYRGKVVLLTGSTGFIGKVCLLRLIESIGSCNQIYVMLRPKASLSAQQRLNKMLNEEPFKSPQSAKNFDFSNVIAIQGDMSCDELGLEQEVKKKLIRSVNIIFNIAASVNFEAPLKQNLRDNYIGTQNLLYLATRFEKLQSFVHVSTFYSNSHLKHIEERVLPMNRDCEKMAELINFLPERVIDLIKPELLENRPNTYVYTKAMAENLVMKFQGRLPLAIVRPSIVLPAERYPQPGWVDNVNGPMGLGVLASLGILRNIDWNYWGVCDFIPVDHVTDLIISTAERTTRCKKDEIKVYNSSTSSLNPTTWGQSFETLRAESLKAPPYKMLRIPIKVPQHKRAGRISMAITKTQEIMFAYFIDFLLTLFGQKTLMVRLTKRMHQAYDMLRPFTTNEYTCSNDNLVDAFDEMHPDDKSVYNYDPKSMDWNQIFQVAFAGARKRLLKEDPSNVPAALMKMRILYVVEFCIKATFYSSLAYLSYRAYGSLLGSSLPITGTV